MLPTSGKGLSLFFWIITNAQIIFLDQLPEESMIHLINDAKLHQEISLPIQANGDKKKLGCKQCKIFKNTTDSNECVTRQIILHQNKYKNDYCN